VDDQLDQDDDDDSDDYDGDGYLRADNGACRIRQAIANYLKHQELYILQLHFIN